jgi:hypothetical protein
MVFILLVVLVQYGRRRGSAEVVMAGQAAS